MRKRIVAGNWKMNKTYQQGLETVSEAVNMIADEAKPGYTAIFCVPFIHLHAVARLVGTTPGIFVAAQNCHNKASGAYTGEVSAEMIKSTGATHVILGHSERREYFGETDALLAEKVDITLANGLTPIFCCGETLETREGADFVAHVQQQITNSLFHLSPEDFGKVVIAYEPIWAIGTGKTATSQQAQEMHQALRAHIASKYGQAVANDTSILYGGSAKPSNAPELFACPDVDGGLIGGASLASRDFTDIVKAL